jgi:hypothetical protein
MGYALVIVLVLLSGDPQVGAGQFPSEEACLAEAAGVRANVVEYNASAEPNKIVSHVAECVPLAKAPQGKYV